MFISNNTNENFSRLNNPCNYDGSFWKWGSDNLFPYALASLSRKSTTHRRIINDKADYISGKGISYDKSVPDLKELIECVNGYGETLRQMLNKLAFDKCLFGNAFMEIITDETFSSLILFHQDSTKCRVGRDKKHIIIHHNWMEYNPSKSQKLPLYPVFEKRNDGTVRSIIHYKDYEPMFENYGVPGYIAGMNVSAIAYKTDKWNISRLDNSFQLSGIMMLDADVDTESEAFTIIKKAEEKFEGKPGQVLFMLKGTNGHENSKFIPVTSSNEGDWKNLHDQATTDIVVAHSWFRSLSGLDYSSGFSSERILKEYEVALNTVITGQQEELLEPIRKIIRDILDIDSSSIQIINRPPANIKPSYMKVWEARKTDGLEYDENDPQQQKFIAEL